MQTEKNFNVIEDNNSSNESTKETSKKPFQQAHWKYCDFNRIIEVLKQGGISEMELLMFCDSLIDPETRTVNIRSIKTFTNILNNNIKNREETTKVYFAQKKNAYKKALKETFNRNVPHKTTIAEVAKVVTKKDIAKFDDVVEGFTNKKETEILAQDVENAAIFEESVIQTEKITPIKEVVKEEAVPQLIEGKVPDVVAKALANEDTGKPAKKATKKKVAATKIVGQ
jgi:hypothetical protein